MVESRAVEFRVTFCHAAKPRKTSRARAHVTFAAVLAAACGSSVSHRDRPESAAGAEDAGADSVAAGSGGASAGRTGGGSGNREPAAGRGGDTSAAAGETPSGAGSNDGEAGEGSCGDGRASDEAEEFGCDDGNRSAGDGCGTDCRVEFGWSCSGEPSACARDQGCGSGVLGGDEACDDGNRDDGDGCSSDCGRIEPGWFCPRPGGPCSPRCGDSELAGAEECDDGNRTSGDGCSSVCRTEPGYVCEDKSCVASVCGNGVPEGAEACDLGASNGFFFGDGTGCSDHCTNEPSCRLNGVTGACSSTCGDANRDPGEECDDGNAVSGDGCSARCLYEPGFVCDELDRPELAACQDGTGLCLRLPIVFRDFDGQNVAGGHPDFFFLGKPGIDGVTRCVPNATGVAPPSLTPGAACPETDASGPCSGIAAETLDPAGRPVLDNTTCRCIFVDREPSGLLDDAPTCTMQDGGTRHYVDTTVRVASSSASFAEWFRASSSSTAHYAVLELAEVDGQYVFSSSLPNVLSGAGRRTFQDDLHANCLGERRPLASGFFPLDAAADPGAQKLCNLWPYWKTGLSAENCLAGAGYPITAQWDQRAGFGATEGDPAGCPATGNGGYVPSADGTGWPLVGVPHNYYFTSELRRSFRYDGPFSIAFRGSGDAWIFVNGKLALDLGGTHDAAGSSAQIDARFGLESGRVYELAVFHANRHPRESDYELVLPPFTHTTTRCVPRCGDAVVTAGEECDAGDQNLGRYGGCTEQCKLGPYCGDGIVNGIEQCDFGDDNGRGDCDLRCRDVE